MNKEIHTEETISKKVIEVNEDRCQYENPLPQRDSLTLPSTYENGYDVINNWQETNAKRINGKTEVHLVSL